MIAFVMLIVIVIGTFGIIGNLDRLDVIRRMPSYLLVFLPVSPLLRKKKKGTHRRDASRPFRRQDGDQVLA